jgi:hypothetical protein
MGDVFQDFGSGDFGDAFGQIGTAIPGIGAVTALTPIEGLAYGGAGIAAAAGWQDPLNDVNNFNLSLFQNPAGVVGAAAVGVANPAAGVTSLFGVGVAGAIAKAQAPAGATIPALAGSPLANVPTWAIFASLTALLVIVVIVA